MPLQQPPRGGFRFHNIDHPDKLKDKAEVQKNRRHVMHDYIAKESQKPMSSDSRVSGASSTRKRKHTDKGPLESSQNPSAPAHIFSSVRQTSAGSVRSNDSLGSSPEQTENMSARYESSALPESTKLPSGSTEPRKSEPSDDVGSAHKYIPRPSRSQAIVRSRGHAMPSPYTRLGSQLNPFETWPTFSDPDLDVNVLKWDCSRRFGTPGMSRYWIPTLLRARPAFLSTLAISTAHDDLMSRGSLPVHMRPKGESLERLRVRQEIISIINESLNDPETETADATIIAVLQLLNAEIMGCDDTIMRVHQKGLHNMVRERGGLGQLGVHGVLASVLTITNYLIGVLRETPPHADYMNFASKQITEPPVDHSFIPESPVYHRKSGYVSIQQAVVSDSATFNLLDHARRLTDAFVTMHRKSLVKKPWTPTTPTTVLDDPESISGHIMAIFAFRPAEELSFREMSDRYTYEAVRLTSCLYALALASGIPISQAATQLSGRGLVPSTMPAADPELYTTSIHVRIKEALVRTGLTNQWCLIPGVLLWIALVAGAAANPQSSAVLGGYVVRREEGEDEEARKWLAAIAIRCQIKLSFEHNKALMGTLKRIVAIQDVLGSGDGEPAISDPLFVETAVIAGLDGAYGPRELDAQRGFADFAQEFSEA